MEINEDVFSFEDFLAGKIQKPVKSKPIEKVVESIVEENPEVEEIQKVEDIIKQPEPPQVVEVEEISEEEEEEYIVVLDGNKNINGIGSITTTGNIIVGGDLTVQGTTTTVNSTTVDIGDNIVQVNVSGSETQGGLQVYDHDNTIARSIVADIS